MSYETALAYAIDCERIDTMICPECGKTLGTQISCHTCAISIDLTAPDGYSRKRGVCGNTKLRATASVNADCYTRYFRYRPMLVAEAKTVGGHAHVLSNMGEIRRVKINGKPKTWKRYPRLVEVPCKYGMYEYFRDTSDNGATMNQLIVLLDGNGNPAQGEAQAEI